MNFQDIQMTQSFGLKQSSNSCRLSSELSCEPYGNLNQNRNNTSGMTYKCYQCSGRTEDSRGSIKSTGVCRTCKGLKEVKDNNSMVGLLMQVMCRKLGKDVPTLKNFPKLQFSVQNKTGQKGNKVQFDPKVKYSTRSRASLPRNKVTKHHKTQPNSQGNSITDSNSQLDSSLDSLDSSHKSSSTARINPVANSNSSFNSASNSNSSLKPRRRTNTLYANQPHFRQQISEIKEESYVTEDYAMCCDLCGREGQGDGYMECKICRHYFLCIKCYNAKVEQIRSGRFNNLKDQYINIELKQKSISNIQGSPTKQMISSNDIIKNKSLQIPLSLAASPNQLRNTSLKIQESEEQDKLKQKGESSKKDKHKEIVVNYDNFYLTHIHEHPLTLCCEPKDENPRNDDDDGIRESTGNCQEKEQYETYGRFLNPNTQTQQSTYKNLFRSYQQPQSPKHQYLKMPIQVIKQQKQSPSVSASGVSISIKSNSPDHHQKYYLDQNQQQLENQSKFSGNISMTVSNNMDSPDTLSKGFDASSNGSPVNIKLGDSDRLDKIDCVGGIRQSEDGRAQGMKMLSLLGPNRVQKLQTKLLPQTKLNLDLSEWSEYSNLYIEDQASNISKQAESNRNFQSQHSIQQNQNNKIRQNKNNEDNEKKMDIKSEAQGLKRRQNYLAEYGLEQKWGVGIEKQADDGEGVRVEKNNEYYSDKKEYGKFRQIKIGVNKTKLNLEKEQDRKQENEKEQDNNNEVQMEVGQTNENTTSNNVILTKNNTQLSAPLVIKEVQQQWKQNQNNITSTLHEYNHVSQKKCHHCQRNIKNRLMYMKCQTCLDYGQIYQLCDQCYRQFQVLDQHQKQQGILHGSLKHVFKAYLHRVSQSTGLDFGMDQQQQEHTNSNIRLSSNSNIFKSTKSFDINPLQNQSYLFTPTEAPIFSTVHNPKLTQPSPTDSQNKLKVKVDQEPEDKFAFNLEIDEQIRKNQIYEKQRQKQNQENSIFVKMYETLITDVYLQTIGFPLSNQNKFGEERHILANQVQNKQENLTAKDENIIDRNQQSIKEVTNSPSEARYSSQINWSFGVFGQQKDSIQLMEGRNSSNVGIEGKWLMDPLQCELHNSFVVDYDKQGGKNAKQTEGPTTTISQIFLYPLPSPQKTKTKPLINQSLTSEQNHGENIINMTTTQQPSSTSIIPNRIQGPIQIKPRPSIIFGKNRVNASSLQDEKQIGKQDEQYSLGKLLVVPVRDKDSPSGRSAKSGGISPTRSKSQVSSRIKVDCGDSESEFELHSISKGNEQIENQDYFSKQAGQTAEPILLSKSISLPKPSEADSILGKEYAVSEPEQDSDDQSSLQQEKMDEVDADNKIGFDLSLGKNKKIEDANNSKSLGIKFTNSYQCKIIQYKSKDEVRQPNQQLQNAERSFQDQEEKMGFLGKIQKSQKLSKSDQQQEYHLNLHQFPIPSNPHPLKLNPFAHSQKPRSKSSLTSSSPSNPSYPPSMIPIPPNDQFVFEDYNCDICGRSPINYRYHCKYCEDFDLCHECIKKCSSHRHRESSDFQKIGEKEERKLILKQKEIQKIMKIEEQSKRSTIIKSVLDMFGSDHSSNALTRSSLPGNLNNAEGVYWQMGSSNSNVIVKQDNKMGTKLNTGNAKSNNNVCFMGPNSNYSTNMTSKANENSKSGCHMKSMILMGRSSRL